MRSLSVLLATLMLFFFAGSAQAATSTTGKALSLAAPLSAVAPPAVAADDDRMFAAKPVSDDALAASYGQAPSRDYLRTANATYASGTFQQNASVARIAMDNWLHDIAAPLIFSNLERQTMT